MPLTTKVPREQAKRLVLGLFAAERRSLRVTEIWQSLGIDGPGLDVVRQVLKEGVARGDVLRGKTIGRAATYRTAGGQPGV